MNSSMIIFGLLSFFIGSCSALRCRECTMSDDDETSCRDQPTKAYSKDCGDYDNRCMTVKAVYTHTRLGTYLLRKCAHSTACNSKDPDIPELNAIKVEEDLTRVECCNTDNCNEQAHGTAITGNLLLALILTMAALMIGHRQD